MWIVREGELDPVSLDEVEEVVAGDETGTLVDELDAAVLEVGAGDLRFVEAAAGRADAELEEVVAERVRGFEPDDPREVAGHADALADEVSYGGGHHSPRSRAEARI